jgi:hypothetical protein
MTNRESEDFDLFMDLFTTARERRSMYDDAQLLAFMRDGVDPRIIAEQNDELADAEDARYDAEDREDAPEDAPEDEIDNIPTRDDWEGFYGRSRLPYNYGKTRQNFGENY